MVYTSFDKIDRYGQFFYLNETFQQTLEKTFIQTYLNGILECNLNYVSVIFTIVFTRPKAWVIRNEVFRIPQTNVCITMNQTILAGCSNK